MATKNKPEPKRAYILTMTARQAGWAVKWTEDFMRNSGPGWAEHFPREARLIRALRAGLEDQRTILTCGRCGARYSVLGVGEVHGDNEARLTCPWCGTMEAAP